MDIPFNRSIVGTFVLPGKGKVAEPPVQEQALISNVGYVVVRVIGGQVSYYSKEANNIYPDWHGNIAYAKVFPSRQKAYGRRGKPPGHFANWKVLTVEQAYELVCAQGKKP